jgi:hypothetical protein
MGRKFREANGGNVERTKCAPAKNAAPTEKDVI